MEMSAIRKLIVPYTFNLGSTTPLFSRGSIEHAPAVSIHDYHQALKNVYKTCQHTEHSAQVLFDIIFQDGIKI